MKKLILKLTYVYPAMFREFAGKFFKCFLRRLDFNSTQFSGGEGRRKIADIERQASLLCDRFCEKLKREKKAIEKKNPSVQGDTDDQPTSKKTKLKVIYGVVSEKWHKKKKVTPQARAKLIQAGKETDFQVREEVYETLREEMSNEFRDNDRKYLDKMCPGFFEDPRHLARHFEYMCESPALDEKIRENLRPFLKHLELFLLAEHDSIEFSQSINDIELVCEQEFQGSSVLKDLHLLRSAAEHFDNGSTQQLIRITENSWISSDPPPSDSSPHILAILVEKSFVYELWAESNKLIGNMDLVTALAAFYHLCFIFSLRYPPEGQTVADLIQRLVCKYGDKSGTKTWKKKEPALAKVSYFCDKTFRLLH